MVKNNCYSLVQGLKKRETIRSAVSGGYRDIQRYRDTEVQRYRDTEIQRYRDTEIQRYRDTDIQRYRDTEIQR